jgi:hypothetical protein
MVAAIEVKEPAGSLPFPQNTPQHRFFAFKLAMPRSHRHDLKVHEKQCGMAAEGKGFPETHVWKKLRGSVA